MTKKYFDIVVEVHFTGYEKEVVNRVTALTAHEAIINAISDEVHSITDDEVEEQVNSCNKNCQPIQVEDADIIYKIGEIIELKEFEAEYEGKTLTALLPKNPDNLSFRSSIHYFAI